MPHIFLPLLGALLLLSLPACGDTSAPNNTGTAPETPEPASPIQHNTLSEAEVAAGWQLLFNGKDLSGWHNYGKTGVGSGWKIDEEGSLYLDPSLEDGGDIVSDASFSNYELLLDWKISDCGNSGIIYNVIEDDRSQYPWQTGPEMQILDNKCHPDAALENHQAASLYDMIAVSERTVLPANEWNRVKLIVTNGHSEHWLNGKKVVEYPNQGTEWETMIAASKFKDMPLFGKSSSGKISLQDHSDKVSFRNIKIRSVPAQ